MALPVEERSFNSRKGQMMQIMNYPIRTYGVRQVEGQILDWAEISPRNLWIALSDLVGMCIAYPNNGKGKLWLWFRQRWRKSHKAIHSQALDQEVIIFKDMIDPCYPPHNNMTSSWYHCNQTSLAWLFSKYKPHLMFRGVEIISHSGFSRLFCYK